VLLSDGSSKALQKNVLQKILPRSFLKGFYKKSGEIRNRFFLDFVYHAFGFWAFLGEGSPKTPDPGPFLASNPPTHHGAHRFVLGAAPCPVTG
jgi:hypothetical protein